MNSELRRKQRKERQKKRRNIQIITRVTASVVFVAMALVIAIQATYIADSVEANAVKVFHAHEIRAKETLTDIANMYLDNPSQREISEFINEVISINRIENPDKIVTGTNIFVPIYLDAPTN